MTFSFVVVVEVSSDAKDLEFTVADPREKVMQTQRKTDKFRFHFAAFDEGRHSICIQNHDARAVMMLFTI